MSDKKDAEEKSRLSNNNKDQHSPAEVPWPTSSERRAVIQQDEKSYIQKHEVSIKQDKTDSFEALLGRNAVPTTNSHVIIADGDSELGESQTAGLPPASEGQDHDRCNNSDSQPSDVREGIEGDTVVHTTEFSSRDRRLQPSPGAVAVPGPGMDLVDDLRDFDLGTRTETSLAAEDDVIISADLVDESALEAQIEERLKRSAVQADVVAESELDKTSTVASRSRWKRWVLGLILLCVLAIIGTVLGIVLSSKRKEDPTPSPAPQLSDSEIIENLLFPVSGAILFNETSPQYKAWQWLLFEDPMKLTPNTTEASVLVERYLVALLYFATEGPGWLSSLGFLTNSSVCVWPSIKEEENEKSNGVRCDSTGSVVYIRIDRNNLNGTVPHELSAAKSLEFISMYGNGLYGTISSSIGNLPRLELLQLNQNYLTGTIPESLAALSNLEYLSLYSNLLNGTIPAGALNIATITHVALEANYLTGTIPEVDLHSPLETLSLALNRLDGPLPKSLVSLLSLKSLYLTGNTLTGTLPAKLGDLKGLANLYLDDCVFSGSIPTELGLLENLEKVRLDQNKLVGTIPTEIGRARKLKVLNLDKNNFTGTIPSELGHLTLLDVMTVQGNALTEVVPSTLIALDTLRYIGLVNNSITGTLDPVFCNRTAPSPIFFAADCYGDTPEVVCTCCTQCCSDTSGCHLNLPLICELQKDEFETDGKQRGASCECEDQGQKLTCTDTGCRYCNQEGTVCAVRGEYGYHFDSRGVAAWYDSRKYVLGRDEVITFVDSYRGHPPCSISVNGAECNSCSNKFVCADGFEAFKIDCENIGEGYVFNGCESGSGAPIFEAFEEDFDQAICDMQV